MFDLIRRWPISMGWYFDKDESGAGGTTDDSAEDKSDDKSDDKKDKSKAGDEKTDPKAEKKFSQAELDQIVKERLDRERKKSESAAEKARREAEEAALAKNQEWQQLAEKRAKDLEALTREKAELEPFKEQADKYKAALNAQLKTIREKLPDYLQEVVDKMDPVEAMDYITKHADKIGAKLSTYSETPEGKEKKVSSEDEKQSQQTSGSIITRVF